jgi:hypothetical protein
MHLAKLVNKPSPLEGEGRVRGALLEEFPLIPSFSLRGRRGTLEKQTFT